jgi:hypothetical protein
LYLHVGIDWGTTRHQVCVLGAADESLGERAVDHDGAGVRQLVNWLLSFTGGEAERVQAAIETPHGAVVDALLSAGMRVFAINPKRLDRLRDRYSVAGAKDDRRDAFVLADSLRTDPRAFAALAPESVEIVELRGWCHLDEELRIEQNALANRLRQQLWSYWPALFRLAADRADPFLWSLLEIASTPEDARRLSRKDLAALLKKHHVRRVTLEDVERILAEAPLPAATGTVNAAAQHVRFLIPRLRLVHQQRKECGASMKKLLARFIDDERAADESAAGGDATEEKREHRDAKVLASLPGVGSIVLATMLAEASPHIAQRRKESLRALGGLAPVTRQSGKTRLVSMRRACSARLRYAFYHWARVAVQQDAACKSHYARLRAKGHRHGRALRGVLDRLLDIALAMLRDGTLYEPQRRAAIMPAA